MMDWSAAAACRGNTRRAACRRGYMIAKTIVERREVFGVSWFLIDELSRMSRNTIESLQLGELAADTSVRVIGASDGFDSANQQSKLEQEVANRERQIARLTARLDKVTDTGGLDAIFDKVAEMERELKFKRAELAEQQRSLGKDLASNAGAMPSRPIEIVVPLKRPGGKEDHGSQDDEA